MRSFVRCIVILLALHASCHALDRTWAGTNSDFHTPSNWTPSGVPGTGERAIIPGDVGNQPTITADCLVGEIVLNAGSGSPAVLTVDGADVTVEQGLILNGGASQVSLVNLINTSTITTDTLDILPGTGGHCDLTVNTGSLVTVTSTCNLQGSVGHSPRILGGGAFTLDAAATMTSGGSGAGQPAIFGVAITQIQGDLVAAQSEINIGNGSAVSMIITGAGSSLTASGSGVKVQDDSTLRTLAGGQLITVGSNFFDFDENCILDIDTTQTSLLGISTFGSSGAPARLQGSANPIFGAAADVTIKSSNGAGGFLRVNESGMVSDGSIFLDSDSTNSNVTLFIPNSTNFATNGSLVLNGDATEKSFVAGPGTLIVGTSGTLQFTGDGNVESILTCDGGIYVQSGQPTITQAPLIVSGDLSVEIAGSLTLSGGLTIDGGSMNVLGTVTATTVLIDNGILEGFGSVIADVTNAGTIRPSGSESTGLLVIDGTYVQTSAGRLEIEIAGVLDYDQLVTNGSTTVFNTIAFEFLNGYVPANNTVFTSVVTTQSNPLTGTFTNVEQDAAVPTVTLTPEYGAGDMNLRATVGTLPGTPIVTSVTASRTLAPVGTAITFTATATEPGGLSLTYEWNFKDGTNGAGTPIAHTFSQGGTFVVDVSVSNGTNSAVGSVSVEILAPNSGGGGEANVGQGKPAVENPLNGLALSIQSSNGGVVELAVDVDALNRDVFDLTTTFDGFVGRQSTRFGPRPTDKFTNPTISVATTTATDEGTTTERGKARRHVAVSSREVGQPVPFTAQPANRDVKLDSMKGKFLFSDTKADQFTFVGRIELPEGLDLSQARTLELAIGNLIDRVELDAKGKTKAKGTQNRIIKAQVKYPKLTKGTTLTSAGQEARITLTMKGVNFSEQGFDTEGIAPTLRTDEAGAKAVDRSIQASILFAGATWEAPIPVQFKLSKNAESGSLIGRGVR